MDGKGPQQRAAELVRGSRLADVAVRRRLAEGGRQAIEASNDPMIRLARLVDKPARRLRTICEQQVGEPQTEAYGRLAKARFALFGMDSYPDATFTLRLCARNGEAVRRERRAGPRLDHHRRAVSLRRGARQRRPVRTAAKLDQAQGPARSGHAAELRLHGRHYRRQLGQPGREPRRPTGGHHLRRRSARFGLGLHLHRSPRAERSPSTAAPSWKPCGRSTTPARWRRN